MPVRSLALAATALPALVSALVLAPLPAFADTVTTQDAAQDVVTQGISDDEATDPAPDRVEGDALSMRVLHGPRNVRINLHSAKLTRSKDLTAVHAFAFRTNAGRYAELTVYVTDGDWQGQDTWTVDGTDRTCRGLHTYVSYASGTVRLVVPRTCLSNPAWVRVGGGSGFLEGDRLYADDVHLDGSIEDRPQLGQRVRRG